MKYFVIMTCMFLVGCKSEQPKQTMTVESLSVKKKSNDLINENLFDQSDIVKDEIKIALVGYLTSYREFTLNDAYDEKDHLPPIQRQFALHLEEPTAYNTPPPFFVLQFSEDDEQNKEIAESLIQDSDYILFKQVTLQGVMEGYVGGKYYLTVDKKSPIKVVDGSCQLHGIISFKCQVTQKDDSFFTDRYDFCLVSKDELKIDRYYSGKARINPWTGTHKKNFDGTPLPVFVAQATKVEELPLLYDQ